MNIFKLCGSIFVDSTAAQDSISKTDSKASGMAKKLGSGIKTAAKWGVGIATAAGAGAAALYKTATSTAETTDRIDKMSQKIGMSRKAFQEWDYVMSQNGMSIDTCKAGLKTLTNQIADAKAGGDKTTAAFKQLGISTKELSTMSKDEIFNKSVAGLQKMKNATDKAALANQLFGRSGVEMAPLLNQSAESTEALKKKANDLGMVLSDKTVDAGVKFTDTMDTIKRTAQGLFANIGGQVIPIFQSLAEKVMTHMPQISAVIGQIGPVLMSLLSGIMPPLTNLAQSIFPILMNILQTCAPIFVQLVQMVLPIITQMLQMILPPLMEIVQALLPPLMQILQALLPVIQPILNILKPIFSLIGAIAKPIASLISAIAPVITILVQLINMALKPVMAQVKIVCGVVETAVKGAIGNIIPIINNIKGVLSGITSFISGVFTGNWKKAFGGLKEIVSNIFGGLLNILKMPINGLITGMNAFIGGLNKIKIPDWVPGVGGKGINIPLIPKLAKGAVLNKSTIAEIGEDGQEAVVPLEKNLEWTKRLSEIIMPMFNKSLSEAPRNDAATADISNVSHDILTAVRDIANSLHQTVEVVLRSILEELKESNTELYHKIKNAIDGFEFKENERELGRLVKKYA